MCGPITGQYYLATFTGGRHWALLPRLRAGAGAAPWPGAARLAITHLETLLLSPGYCQHYNPTHLLAPLEQTAVCLSMSPPSLYPPPPPPRSRGDLLSPAPWRGCWPAVYCPLPGPDTTWHWAIVSKLHVNVYQKKY